MDDIRRYGDELCLAIKNTIDYQSKNIERAVEVLEDRLAKGGKILTCGNGGSAAEAAHLTGELMIRLKPNNNRIAIPSVCLNSDSVLITACVNDYGNERLFARQVEGLGKEEDALVCFTTSGTSKNVVEAAKLAKERGMAVVSLIGLKGDSMSEYSDAVIKSQSNEVARIQEVHQFLVHYIADQLERKYNKKE